MRLTILQAPADTSCFRLVAAGGRREERRFPLSPGHASIFTMTGLPVGQVVFGGEAFAENCSMVSATTVPSWVSDPVTASVAVKPVVEVTLSLRRNGRASVRADFIDDPDAGPTAPDAGPPDSAPSSVAVFRMSDLDLRDPHLFVSFFGCNDMTDSFAFAPAFNARLQTTMTTDGDGDGNLDFSPTLVFRGADQTDGAATPMEFHSAACTAPLASTSCRPSGTLALAGTATSMVLNQCLAPIPGTTRPYTPAVNISAGPCFASNPETLTLELAGIPIALRDARIAATYVDDPASRLVNGLITGFLSEADASRIVLPSSLPLVGGEPLTFLLAGSDTSCASHSDKDTNAGVVGWWFYFNFTASRVPWSEN